MIEELLQIIAVILLLYVIIIDVSDKRVKDPIYQLIVAIIIMFIFIVIDPFAGFILALVMFIVYYKTFIQPPLHKKNNFENTNENINWKANNDIHYTDYLNSKHLDIIQDNIWDKNNFNQEVVGINDGFIETNTPIYGIQGMNIEMPAYDNNTNYQIIKN